MAEHVDRMHTGVHHHTAACKYRIAKPALFDVGHVSGKSIAEHDDITNRTSLNL
jgi:hypothetical protein